MTWVGSGKVAWQPDSASWPNCKMNALQRREELYGPGRTLQREIAKRLQQEDHVKLSVSRGAGIDLYDSSDAYASVSSEAYRAHSGSKLVHSTWDPSAQNVTHLQFGSDEHPQKHSSVLQTDYGPKPVTQYKQHLPSDVHLTNIPDLAARYQNDRATGKSLYHADFDGNKSYREWSTQMASKGKKVGRRQKTTLFQKGTHFELGSDPPSLESETTNSFSTQQTSTQQSIVCVDRSKSNVFRAEDFVSSHGEEKERFLSIQQKDFTGIQSPSVSTGTTVEYSHVKKRELPTEVLTSPLHDDAQSTTTDTYSARAQSNTEAGSEGEFMGGQYQTATHFHFGDSLEPSSSIYNQDFSSEEVTTNYCLKQLPAPPPPSSKVMHQFPIAIIGVSTSRRDFVRHNISQREGQRLASLNANKERHSKLAVELKTGDQDKIMSVMAMSYPTPPAGVRPSTPCDPFPKDYHHLESNRALMHAPKGGNLTEACGNFTAPLAGPKECLSRRLSALGERTSRISDNKNTHFVLGFDESVALTEKMGQFGRKSPVNPNFPAAGKPNLPTKGYSVIEHSTEGSSESADNIERLQSLLQQRNYLKNINPRDPLNVNLRKAFVEYDKDLSGSISKDEIKQVCKEIGLRVDEMDLNSIITSCDKNGTGQIDYHDFALYLSRQYPPQGSVDQDVTTTARKDFKHPDAQKMSHMQQLVLRLDAKKYVPVESSHYFHLDSQDDYLLSTTRKDFIKPEHQ